MDQEECEFASLFAAINSFPSECTPKHSHVSSVLDTDLTPGYRPIKFSRSTRVPLDDLERTFHAFLSELNGHEALCRIREFIHTRPPLMRIIECVIYICRYAEEKYHANEQLIAEASTEWRQLLKSNEQISMRSFFDVHSSSGEGGIDLNKLHSTVSGAKVHANKLLGMLSQIGEMVHIPKLVDGVLLRYSISYLYALLFHQHYLLGKLQVWLLKVQSEVDKLNEQFAKLKS